MMNLFARLFAWLPRRWALAIGAGFGSLVYTLGIRRSVSLSNLRRVFPERTEEERRQIARASYRLHGRNAAEFFSSAARGNVDLAGRVTFDRARVVEAARGHGAIIAMAHFGSWEVMGEAAAQTGLPITVLTRRLSGAANAGWRKARAAGGLSWAHQGELGLMVAALRRGELVAISYDQNMPRSRGIFVDFFGEPACTTPAPSVLALRTGAPIFAAFPLLREDGTHDVQLEGPLPIDPTLPAREAVQKQTQALAKVLEHYIRDRSDHWYWLHRRWKTRP